MEIGYFPRWINSPKFFVLVTTEENKLIWKWKPGGQPKAYRKYTIGAKRLKRAKQEGKQKPHMPSSRVQPIKKID